MPCVIRTCDRRRRRQYSRAQAWCHCVVRPSSYVEPPRPSPDRLAGTRRGSGSHSGTDTAEESRPPSTAGSMSESSLMEDAAKPIPVGQAWAHVPDRLPSARQTLNSFARKWALGSAFATLTLGVMGSVRTYCDCTHPRGSTQPIPRRISGARNPTLVDAFAASWLHWERLHRGSPRDHPPNRSVACPAVHPAALQRVRDDWHHGRIHSTARCHGASPLPLEPAPMRCRWPRSGYVTHCPIHALDTWRTSC